jgi:hypothetical protein
MKPSVLSLTIACTLAAIALAHAEPTVDNNQPPTPSSTKERFAPPFTGGKPGDLLSQKEIGTDIKGARAWKVRYVSKDVNDVVHEVTGLIIAPKEKGEDRKVLTWCHGTTGLGDASCPSTQPNPARELIAYYDAPSTQQIDYGVPGLQGFIDDGYVVCATDYQGQGSPGQHQYEVNRTQARDAVYLIHAARELDLGMGAGRRCGRRSGRVGCGGLRRLEIGRHRADVAGYHRGHLRFSHGPHRLEHQSGEGAGDSCCHDARRSADREPG